MLTTTWRAGVVIALVSGIGALSILALPLLLVLLMVLFDTVAHGLLVLLGMIVTWAATLLQSGGGLPPYSAIALAPLPVALHAALRSAPCLAGIMLVLFRPRPGRSWWLVALLWGASAAIGGGLAAVTLLPGLAVAVALAVLPQPSAAASPSDAASHR
ncbi:hypothetical protein [Lichenicola sp.]|uniref:hypothetical protein n=1 Tax=Lichenicola sp. TaxID=2804529 RepID=UPI003AFFAB6D